MLGMSPKPAGSPVARTISGGKKDPRLNSK